MDRVLKPTLPLKGGFDHIEHAGGGQQDGHSAPDSRTERTHKTQTQEGNRNRQQGTRKGEADGDDFFHLTVPLVEKLPVPEGTGFHARSSYPLVPLQTFQPRISNRSANSTTIALRAAWALLRPGRTRRVGVYPLSIAAASSFQVPKAVTAWVSSVRLCCWVVFILLLLWVVLVVSLCVRSLYHREQCRQVQFAHFWKIVVPGGTGRYNARMKTISQQAFALLERYIEKGWSINAIATASGVSRVGLQRWYSGSRGAINAETLDGLCKWFGVKLTRGKVPKPPETHHRKPTKKGANDA